MFRKKIFLVVSAFALFINSAAFPASARALGSINVNTDADNILDDGLCSLREAITNANGDSQLYATAGECPAGSGADTISFAADYTITLVGSQLPAVTTLITINGNGEANTIIEANAAPNTATYRVFEVGAAGNLTLKSLTVRNGNCNGSWATGTDSGGGIYNAGTLTAFNVTFNSNYASGSGGGMYNLNNSKPTLTNVTFSANYARYGGGMFNFYSSATLTNVTFSANSAGDGGGGGMFNSYSNPTLMDVTFSANSTTNRGGGMASVGSNPMLTNVTFSTNSSSNGGGGMYNEYGYSMLTNVTFSANSSSNGGGGMYNYSSDPTLTNVTFSANSALWGGGMSNVYSSPTLTNVTFSANSASTTFGGGLFNTLISSPTLKNVIIANSVSSGDCYNDLVKLDATSSNNLIEDAANACGLTNGVNGNIIGSDPLLGALANNGGSTQTHALLAGSPAINSGTNAGCPATDQRGMTRPQGTTCDIGAFEYDLPLGVLSSARVSASPTNLSSVDFTVTFSESVTGVDVSDFNPTTSGVSSAAVSGVSGSGSAYTVTVNTGSGDGTIRLDVVDDNSILEAAGNPLGGAAIGDGDFITGEVYTVNKSSIFADVPLPYWSNNFIERLYAAQFTTGCMTIPLSYCPTTPVTRAQMAIFLLRGMHGSAYTPPPATGTVFTDVPLGTFGDAWIEQLAAEGITSGCGGGNYCPNQPVSRAQMAIFLVYAKHGVAFVPPTATGIFPDVPVGSFGADFIEQLAADGITNGCGGGNYCPNTMVKRDSMAVFLVKTFNLP